MEPLVTAEEQAMVIMAPVPNSDDYTVSVDLWTALTTEIDSVVARIDGGEELAPEDVTNVRSLVKQVESYLTSFNKAMRDAQAKYKGLVAKKLESLGYPKIEAYIQVQRKKQVDDQNARIAAKQAGLRARVEQAMEQTVHVKETALKNELLPAFAARFPVIGSGAKGKDISNWSPYEAIIGNTLKMLDIFFHDKAFDGATNLPVTSATMSQLLAYVRSGDLNLLSVMRQIFAKDAELLTANKLRTEITTKEVALSRIGEILKEEKSADEKLSEIIRITRIAEYL